MGDAPDNAEYVVLTADPTLTAERILTGTANQVIVTDGGAENPVTLSTPQDIDTAATPKFAKLELEHASDPQLRLTHSGSEYADLEVNADGDLIITQGGTPTTHTGACGLECARMSVGDSDKWGGNLEVVNIYRTYTTSNLGNNPIVLDIHAVWDDTGTATNKVLWGAHVKTRADDAGETARLFGLGASASTNAAATITDRIQGIDGSASVGNPVITDGGSCPLVIGVGGGCYPTR